MKLLLGWVALAAAIFSCFLFAGCDTLGTTPSTAAAPTAPPKVLASAAVSTHQATAEADMNRKTNPITPYPFTTCAVIRKDFGKEGPKYRRVYQGQEVLICCIPCLNAFDANPDAFMPRIKAAAAAKARGETVNSGW
jgi:hypothetical protein